MENREQQISMFQPIHLLDTNTDELKKYQERWHTTEGYKIQEYIIEKIKNGAGEDFLQYDYEVGKLSILENEWDLRGIEIWKLDITFPKHDTFEAIDFSYSRFWHSKFKNAAFVGGGGGAFTRIYNCQFINCLFYLCGWRGCTFENVEFVECDFMEHTYFVNCEFKNCEFTNCFLKENIFSDCLFDVNASINQLKKQTNNFGKFVLDNKDLQGIYKGVKDAYGAGEVYDKYRDYFFEQKASETKYLKKGFSKIPAQIQESMTGYGVRPLRIVEWALFIILLFVNAYILIFKQSVDVALITSLSAFATMGNVPNISLMNYLYLLESLLGIGLFALFITVLANVWFGEK